MPTLQHNYKQNCSKLHRHDVNKHTTELMDRKSNNEIYAHNNVYQAEYCKLRDGCFKVLTFQILEAIG